MFVDGIVEQHNEKAVSFLSGVFALIEVRVDSNHRLISVVTAFREHVGDPWIFIGHRQEIVQYNQVPHSGIEITVLGYASNEFHSNNVYIGT